MTGRLRRLLEDELGDCCQADVDERLAELERLEDAATADSPAADLRALSTLGNETRYRLIRLLVTADEALCVCEFSPLVDVSESAVSHALSDLTDAGLASRTREGKWRYYESTPLAERLLTALEGGA